MCSNRRDISAVTVTSRLCRKPIPAPVSVSLGTAKLCGATHTRRMLREIALRRALGAVAPLALIVGACGGEDGNLVPLSGIVVYLGLFREGSDVPSNSLLLGDRFRATEGGVAVFDDLGVTQRGRFSFRALTDDLPEHGPHGPQPALFSDQFEVD
jgi:hypothetical protein